MKKVFDARCLRCDSINAIDAFERLGEADDSVINNFLYSYKEIYCLCTKCNKDTLHKVVTGIYECSSDNDNV